MNDFNKRYYPDLVLQMLCRRLLKPESKYLSMKNIRNIRSLGATCRHFYRYMRKHYPQYYDLILFFKGKMTYSRINHSFFSGIDLRLIPTTDEFWVIPRPIGSASYGTGRLGSYIRFSHFCFDQDYDDLKREILLKQFRYTGHPMVTDVISPLAETDPEFEKIKTRLNRICKGKIKKLKLHYRHQNPYEVDVFGFDDIDYDLSL